MFTVKATYRNETRRFSFPDSVLFPTYKELYHQLYRVFPISQDYYLSRLIFSPDSHKPGRILVGKEVHSAEDYDSSVAPLRRLWPNPLLRFTVFDETPHKQSTMTSELVSTSLSMTNADEPSFGEPTEELLSFPPPPCTTHFIPLLPPPSPFPAPLITPSSTVAESGPPQACGRASSESCCTIAKGKADIETLLTSFKEDIDEILCRTLGSDRTEKQMAPSVLPPTSTVSGTDIVLETPPVDLATNVSSRWCFLCKSSFTGIWYGCNKCPWHAICPSCFSKSPSVHTLSFGPSHVVQQQPDRSALSSAQTTSKNKSCSCVPGSPRPIEIVQPGATPEPTPSVHYGVICDGCSSTIVGVRHKCSDCPDYDLCTACVESGATEQHNPFHEFLDIQTPWCVPVHTVTSNHRETQQRPITNPTSQPIRHSATCNLCDSVIVGERYKCVMCPDFDTCSSCFRITVEQHPGHGFVRVQKPEDLMMRDSIPLRRVTHLALCNSCQKTIHGARYKCMHPSCPDFDLCSNCEALPIPVHPLNHPMLKLKTPESIIPTLYRGAQGQSVSEPTTQNSAPDCCGSKSPVLRPRGPLATSAKSPEPTPVNVTIEDQMSSIEDFLSSLGSPASEAREAVHVSASVTPLHPSVHAADLPVSPRPDQPTLDVSYRLWPEVNQEMTDLSTFQVPKAKELAVDLAENNAIKPVSQEPIATEETFPGGTTSLLISQLDERAKCPVSLDQSAQSIVDDYLTPSSTPSVEEPHMTLQQTDADDQQELVIEDAAQRSCLDSSLAGDINVPDGQVFPPGAEFVKGWHMANKGELPWPSTTEIAFVAGEMFAPERSSALRAKVGVVHPGRDLDVWTGDLKAPDTPGRYVGYWRLNDGQGNFFGSNVWIDLTVADHHSDQSSEHSLAASSMVMPSAHPTDLVDARSALQDALPPSEPYTKTITDENDGPGSDISSVSLVSVPTSDDEDADWQDTRTHSEPLEYVVLYDSNSEE